MLTLETMGILALAILWVNTVLVVAAAWTPLRWLGSRVQRTYVQASITTADAADGVFARNAIEQVGRRASDDSAREAILFHDRHHESDMRGGAVRVAGAAMVIPPQPAEVWFTAAAKRELADRFDVEFAAAYRASRRAKGFIRTVKADIVVGDDVWLSLPVPTARSGDGALIVTTYEPRSWLRLRMIAVFGFQIAMLAVTATATFLALREPLFGTVSTVGGVIGLLHFLLVLQPLGVAVREWCALPHLAAVRGSWVNAGTDGTGTDGVGSDGVGTDGVGTDGVGS